MQNIISRNNQTISDVGFLRLSQVLKIIPVGKSTWWAKVKSGEYPKPVKLGIRTTAWRASDIQTLIENIDSQGSNMQSANTKNNVSKQ
jgi:predicted DNA-binding transcriptional regulator AlpA